MDCVEDGMEITLEWWKSRTMENDLTLRDNVRCKEKGEKVLAKRTSQLRFISKKGKKDKTGQN